MNPLPIAVMACVCTSSALAGLPALTTEVVASGLSQPTLTAFDPGDASPMFVLEKSGRVRLFEDGVLRPTPFLDLSATVTSSTFGGMTGFAFGPDFETSGHVYVIYPAGVGTNGDRVEIARYTVSASDPDVIDPASRRDILSIPNGFNPQYHIGGTICFGPDGFLYVPLGDGTNTGAEALGGMRSQSLDSYWGKTLRIDPTGDDFPGDPARNYAIPADNPFVGMGVLGEVWNRGLRNPFRASFDRETGDFWIADVGLFQFEEIDVENAGHAGGRNYGWNCAEGTACSTNANCDCADNLTGPVHVYARGASCSITGGAVYRGCAIDGLDGRYFFSDWCSGRVWSLAYDGTSVSDVVDHTTELNNGGAPNIDRVTSISEDPFGELYITAETGSVYKVLPAAGVVDDNGNGVPDSCELGNAADLDGNGTVGSSDLGALLAAWGPCDGACPEDLDGDGEVGSADLGTLLAAWG